MELSTKTHESDGIVEPTGLVQAEDLGPTADDSDLRNERHQGNRADDFCQTQLAQRRLGPATSLFTALRLKHPATAAHCLRVALHASSWAMSTGLPSHQHDLLEVGALLHDIGKLLVPDHLLNKPRQLSAEEIELIRRRIGMGSEILQGSCTSGELLDIVHCASARYDGGNPLFDRRGAALPLESRMIAIVDAFDSMTTEQVYRRAMSRECALTELLENEGTQFDPQLLGSFGRFLLDTGLDCNELLARRWLHENSGARFDEFWLPQSTTSADGRGVEKAFQDRLLESMHDAVVFVDQRLAIFMWNTAAERMTGIEAEKIVGKQWTPGFIQLRDENGADFSAGNCPVVETMRSGIQAHRRLTMLGRFGRRLAIDMHAAPVLAGDGQVRGAAIVLHDASSQTTLEERVEALYERATRDPLTKVANRAEFDRVFPEFVDTHQQQNAPCSLIICDIDHFKSVNDTHGHQAGDEALIEFAAHLKSHARSTDLVARYGGEEFVVLCSDCDDTAATQRAENIRRTLEAIPLPALDNRSLTASFGVTGVHDGDTPETFLRRADRALLRAKDSGRNLVMRLGSGSLDDEDEASSRGWFNWLRNTPITPILERTLIAFVPLAVAAEKLRGFIADRKCEVRSLEDYRVQIKTDAGSSTLWRRGTDRPLPLAMEVAFASHRIAAERSGAPDRVATLIHVTVKPLRRRDRRQNDIVQRARWLLGSLKSYLIAEDYFASSNSGGPEATDEPLPNRFADSRSQFR